MDESIIAELRQICSGEKDETKNFLGLEEFCSLYSTDDILKTIMRRREVHTNIMNFFFQNITNANKWTINPLKVMVSFAVTHGNPLFEKIPYIIS